MNYTQIIKQIKAKGRKKNIAGMARFGITSKKAKIVGSSVTEMRQLAKKIGTNHELALKLWDSKIHEARILATIIADPKEMTPSLAERWIRDADYWDLCDALAGDVLDQTKFIDSKIKQWARRKPEYQKRMAFSSIAWLAVHDKTAPDSQFLAYLPIIKKAATDERNFVKKAVSWALRNIGKRNPKLKKAAMKTVREILKQNSPAAKWIARDAIRELSTRK